MTWLDTWAKLLLQQQYILEQQLAKFAPVIPGQGLVRHTPQRSDWSSPGSPLTPTGGIVSDNTELVAFASFGQHGLVWQLCLTASSDRSTVPERHVSPWAWMC